MGHFWHFFSGAIIRTRRENQCLPYAEFFASCQSRSIFFVLHYCKIFKVFLDIVLNRMSMIVSRALTVDGNIWQKIWKDSVSCSDLVPPFRCTDISFYNYIAYKIYIYFSFIIINLLSKKIMYSVFWLLLYYYIYWITLSTTLDLSILGS